MAERIAWLKTEENNNQMLLPIMKIMAGGNSKANSNDVFCAESWTQLGGELLLYVELSPDKLWVLII
jgi:hypothetical protein